MQEMRVGPSEPAVRSRLQTTASCDGQEPWWRALRKRRDLILSGKAQRDERKRTADEVSKAYGRCRNRGEVVNPGRVWGVS